MTLSPWGHPTRRSFLARNVMGLGSVALAWLLDRENLLGAPHIPRVRQVFDNTPKRPHVQSQATAMISLFMHGGPSHVDLLDPKPLLTRFNGTEYAGAVKHSFVKRASKQLMASPWKFKKHGQVGTEVSELLPHLGEIVDDIAVIRSMHTDINGHNPSIRYMNTGKSVPSRPSLGSWLTYALGSESQDLPAFVVMSDPGGLPVDGVHNWSHGWLPSLYQGTVVRPREPRILNLDPPPHLRGTLQQQNLSFLDRLNREHLERHPGEADLDARIASYELAARMQTAAKEALDVSGESKVTRILYGLDDPVTCEYGTRCLIARRLVERGVRFVQLFLGGQPWDTHSNIRESLPKICRRTDLPAVALVKDLKSRGLLDTTLVHWGGEFGRLPVTETSGQPGKEGRDHNGQGFSMWLAGGGIRGGITYGQTDDFGHRAAVDPVSPNDYQATLLHLLGVDHRRLVYQYNGQEHRLTDNDDSRIVRDILANG